MLKTGRARAAAARGSDARAPAWSDRAQCGTASRASTDLPSRRRRSARAECARRYSASSPRASRASIRASPAIGPSRIAIAAARLSSTDRRRLGSQQQAVERRNLRPIRVCGAPRFGVTAQSRPAACRDRNDAIRAHARRVRCRRPSCSRSQADRSCSSSSTISPAGEARAARLDSCSSISASRPIASDSGRRSTSSRPSRMASLDRSCLVSDAPEEAEYPSLKTR